MATADFAVAEALPVSSSSTHRADRRANGSPPPAPAMSKRDKRRQALADRIAAISDRETRERDHILREHLQRVQYENAFIMRFDPYADRPFDVFDDEQVRIRQRLATERRDATAAPLLDSQGPVCSRFLEKAQDLVEQRDYHITKYKLDFEKKSVEHKATYAYKVESATREHRALAQSIRDRLINAITTKKFRLNKEKEVLEISDASALLLHPNQFSITNPASPGGTQHKRATRLRREMEDMAGMDGSKKRKRNANDEDGSPAPQRRALDHANTTPLWQNERLALRNATGSIFSIDKLFTDKELSLTYNTAALSAYKYLITHKPKYDEHGHIVPMSEDSDSTSGEHDDPDASDSVPSAPMMERHVSHATRSGRGSGGGGGGGGGGSNNNTATAGSNNGTHSFIDDKLTGLEALASLAVPGNIERMMAQDPKMPPAQFPSLYIKNHGKVNEYNTPMALAHDDVGGDLSLMNILRQYDQQSGGAGASIAPEAGAGSRRLLEVVSEPARDGRYTAYLQGERPHENDIRRRLGLPIVAEQVECPTPPPGLPNPNGAGGNGTGNGNGSGDGSGGAVPAERIGTPSKNGRSGTPGPSPAKGSSLAAAMGGVSMSRQSSANGAPMSRSSSRKGRGRGQT